MIERRKTRAGFEFDVRPVTGSDAGLLAAFFEHVTPDDIRFRYLSMAPYVSPARIQDLIHVDHKDTESYLAFDPGGGLVAIAMLAGGAGDRHGEVAIVVHADYKAHGIGWALLHYLVDVAAERGLETIESIESRENHAAIQVERDSGFVGYAVPDSPTLVRLVKSLADHRNDAH